MFLCFLFAVLGCIVAIQGGGTIVVIAFLIASILFSIESKLENLIEEQKKTNEELRMANCIVILED